MILIDTSAWIAFFRGTRSLATDAVDRALQDGTAALGGPVLTELRRGVRSKVERAKLILHLKGCLVLPQPENLWEEAGDLGFILARRGISVGTLDLLIATFALAHEVPLLTTDTDFVRIREAGIPLLLA